HFLERFFNKILHDFSFRSENRVSEFRRHMKRVRVRKYFYRWRNVTRVRVLERNLRLEKQKKNLESFPPVTFSHSLSPEEMLTTWCGVHSVVSNHAKGSKL